MRSSWLGNVTVICARPAYDSEGGAGGVVEGAG
jgi:hypothetical protein